MSWDVDRFGRRRGFCLLRWSPMTYVVVCCTSLVVWATGCTHPCDALEKTVCEELNDERRCGLMQEPERREELSREACESINDALARR